MTERKKPREVELVKPDYQPTKAEAEEPLDVDVPGETVLDRMANLTRALTQPVKIRWINRPRSRRR